MISQLATHYGTMFVPDNDCGQYWWLANTGGSPEDEFIEAICGLLDDRPKGTAVDVGANFGCWTLALAKHAHHVVALEPQPCVGVLLAASIRDNGLKNVRLMNVAAGAAAGTARIPNLDIDKGSNFGGVMLDLPFQDQQMAPMVEVNVVTLDTILNGEQVSFIKIDVEGHEAEVLRGALVTLARCKPVLFLEVDHIRSDEQALRQTIERIGYTTERRGGNLLALPL